MNTIFDYSALFQWFIASIITIVSAYAIAELANLLVTTRSINAIQNTASSAINALVTVHNTSTIANSSSNSQDKQKS